MSNLVVSGRIVHCHLAVADKYGGYTCSILVDKSDPVVALIKEEVEGLIQSEFNGTAPKESQVPVEDAAKKFGDEYSEYIRLKCKSTEPVPMVDAELRPLSDNKAFPNGCDVKAQIAFSAYSSRDYGNGLTCFINAIQFVAKNDPIGRAAANPSDIFAPIAKPKGKGSADAPAETKPAGGGFFS